MTNSPKKEDTLIKPDQPSPLKRFMKSMKIDYEKWHDGIGYDLEAIDIASPQERLDIERMLASHKPMDWRDIEALAKLDTKIARQSIKAAIKDPNPAVRAAVERYAPNSVTKAERIQSIVDALKNARVFSGLSPVLDEVENFHPPEVKEELIRGLLSRDGETATLFAGMLFFLYGKAKEPFDWQQRSFFLRFNTENKEDRVKAFRELCKKLDINPDKFQVVKSHNRTPNKKQ